MNAYFLSFQYVYKAIFKAHIVIFQKKTSLKRLGWREDKGVGNNTKPGKNEAKIKI